MSGFTFGGATTPAGGSLFGATPAASAAGSLFGAKPTTPGSNNLFGAAAQPATPASGTGLFGSTPALSTPASGGLFGATATPATGLFGAATTSATPAAGGLFGATTTSTAPAAGGLFGAPAASAAPATGGFFGGTPASGIGSNLFGAASSTAPASGGFFGAKPAASGFSFAVPGTSTAPAAGSLFGAAPKPFGSSGFGTSTATTVAPTIPGFGASLASGQRQQYVIGNVKPEIPVWYNLMYIKNSWDPTHPNCQFKYFFYNFVHPDDVNKYGPPPNVDPFEWQQAVRECPDKECMVPALAIGFEDLKKRMETQNDMTEMQRIKLEEIEVKMNEIMQFHVVQTATKVREFKRRHIQLAQRVLTLMKRVQILRNRGVPIREDEELLRVRLENALEQLRNPAHFRGKITELWAQLQILKDSKRLHPYSSHGVPDASQLEAVGKVLQEQQAGLAHITSIIQQDMEDIEILQRKLEETKRA